MARPRSGERPPHAVFLLFVNFSLRFPRAGRSRGAWPPLPRGAASGDTGNRRLLPRLPATGAPAATSRSGAPLKQRQDTPGFNRDAPRASSAIKSFYIGFCSFGLPARRLAAHGGEWQKVTRLKGAVHALQGWSASAMGCLGDLPARNGGRATRHTGPVPGRTSHAPRGAGDADPQGRRRRSPDHRP